MLTIQCGWCYSFKFRCQNLQVQDFVNDLKQRNPKFDKPLYIFEQQQSQSEEQLIAESIVKHLKD
jgi:altronate hydrolase